MNADQLSRLRFVVFLCVGLIICGYGVLALILGRPDPIWPWISTVAGVGAGALIYLSAVRSGKKVAGASFDELFDVEWRRALNLSYWVAIALYPLFVLPLAMGLLSSVTAFAAMGTLSGGAPMLLFCLITLRS